MLISMLVSTLLLVGGLLSQIELLVSIAWWQYIAVHALYVAAALVMVSRQRGRIRQGFRKIEEQYPELSL
jgi:hypothetical protein